MKLKIVVDKPILHSKSIVDLVVYDGKIINKPFRNVYQKLVDCKIYNSSTRDKSIQSQSTTTEDR